MTDFDFERPPNMSTPDGVMLAEWLSRQFLKVSNSFINVEDNFVHASYGGLRLNVPVAGPNLVLNTWQVLSQYDALLTPTPRHVEQDITNNGIILEKAAVYEINLGIEFAHNQDNANPRRIFVQLYNATDGIQGQNLTIDTAIRSSNTVRYMSFQFDVLAPWVDKLVQVRIGNGSAYSSVVWSIQSFSIFQTSENRD